MEAFALSITSLVCACVDDDDADVVLPTGKTHPRDSSKV